jgi:hypothetical protein
MGGFGLADIGPRKAAGPGIAIQMIGFHRCSFTRDNYLDEHGLYGLTALSGSRGFSDEDR